MKKSFYSSLKSKDHQFEHLVSSKVARDQWTLENTFLNLHLLPSFEQKRYCSSLKDFLPCWFVWERFPDPLHLLNWKWSLKSFDLQRKMTRYHLKNWYLMNLSWLHLRSQLWYLSLFSEFTLSFSFLTSSLPSSQSFFANSQDLCFSLLLLLFSWWHPTHIQRLGTPLLLSKHHIFPLSQPSTFQYTFKNSTQHKLTYFHRCLKED